MVYYIAAAPVYNAIQNICMTSLLSVGGRRHDEQCVQRRRPASEGGEQCVWRRRPANEGSE
jgi:hypothetical protein